MESKSGTQQLAQDIKSQTQEPQRSEAIPRALIRRTIECSGQVQFLEVDSEGIEKGRGQGDGEADEEVGHSVGLVDWSRVEDEGGGGVGHAGDGCGESTAAKRARSLGG